jgi:prevent-host-death family protein
MKRRSQLPKTSEVANLGESVDTGVAVISVSATEIKNRLGQFLLRVAVEPVVVEKNGRPVAVLLSWEEYEVLQRSDDHFWGQAARAAEAEGFLSTGESLDYLQHGQPSEGRAAS